MVRRSAAFSIYCDDNHQSFLGIRSDSGAESVLIRREASIMENRKTALVLGGGGSRGAYEIGVWQALRELGIKIDVITGSSVGAINGALIVQDTFDLAVSLWKEIETPMVFDMEIKDIIANTGIGTNKLKDLLTKYIDEADRQEIRHDYGLVTLELPSMAPKFYNEKSRFPREC
jgi:NTE family protein